MVGLNTPQLVVAGESEVIEELFFLLTMSPVTLKPSLQELDLWMDLWLSTASQSHDIIPIGVRGRDNCCSLKNLIYWRRRLEVR